jgi:hypothetical protein
MVVSRRAGLVGIGSGDRREEPFVLLLRRPRLVVLVARRAPGRAPGCSELVAQELDEAPDMRVPGRHCDGEVKVLIGLGGVGPLADGLAHRLQGLAHRSDVGGGAPSRRELSRGDLDGNAELEDVFEVLVGGEVACGQLEAQATWLCGDEGPPTRVAFDVAAGLELRHRLFNDGPAHREARAELLLGGKLRPRKEFARGNRALELAHNLIAGCRRSRDCHMTSQPDYLYS